MCDLLLPVFVLPALKCVNFADSFLCSRNSPLYSGCYFSNLNCLTSVLCNSQACKVIRDTFSKCDVDDKTR